MKTKFHRAITPLLFALCAILSASAAEKPNVLLIMADDLRNFGGAFPQLLRQGGWTAHSFGKILHSANTGETQREGEVRNLTGGKPCSLWQTRTGRRDR